MKDKDGTWVLGGNNLTPEKIAHYGTLPCFHFVNRGECARGDKCSFMHKKTDCSVAVAGKVITPSPESIEAYDKAVEKKAKKAMICAAVMKPGLDEEWALDTCAADDVANPDTVGKLTADGGGTAYHIAGGIVSSDIVVETSVPGIAEVAKASQLLSTPNALAIGKRRALAGYGFYWHP